jgi:hypothetical protein
VGSPSTLFADIYLSINENAIEAASNKITNIQAFHKPISKAGIKDMIGFLSWLG